MGDLLARVLEAHGGIDRWARVRTVTARLSIGGPFWGRKGWPEIFGDQTTLELDARRQHIVVTPFNGAGRRSTFDVNPERIVVHTNDGVVVERRDDPRASFAGYEVTTPWDALQVGYFISYACWNYLTAPFLFTYPGVETRELEPRQEDGETWRRLHVTFPRSIATHSTEQVFYYGADFIQRRMDYSVEVNGDVLVAQYQYEPKTFQGLVFPTQRRIHRRSPDGTADQSQTSITLDITDIEIDSHEQPQGPRYQRRDWSAHMLDPDGNNIEVVDHHRPGPGLAETSERKTALMTHQSERKNGGSTMETQTTITANTELVEEFIRRVFNEHNAAATPDYFTPDVQWHGGTLGTIEGSDAMTSFYGELFGALPDLHATTLAVVADEDTVWCRFAVEGTNEGSLFGFPATGKTVRWDEIDTYRVANGKIAEEWSSPDMTNILHQIGAYTPPWIS